MKGAEPLSLSKAQLTRRKLLCSNFPAQSPKDIPVPENVTLGAIGWIRITEHVQSRGGTARLRRSLSLKVISHYNQCVNTDFRRGVELLNSERYFEAHEALEDAWRAALPESKRFYQGMVQIAVALHHYSRGNLTGARSVLERAVRNVSGWPQGFAGIDLDGLRAQLREWSKCVQEGSPAPAWPKIEWQVTDAGEQLR